MYRAIFAFNGGRWRIPACVCTVLICVLTLSASPHCFAIDLVSTNSAGVQGTPVNFPQTSAVSNDGDTVLFTYRAPEFGDGATGPFFVKTMSTGNLVPVYRRPDGVPGLVGGSVSFAYMDEPPTRVVFTSSTSDLVPNSAQSGDRIFTTMIGSFQYFPARGLPDGPGLRFDDFTVNSRLDRVFLQLGRVTEVSATLPTTPIIHSLRTDGVPSQYGGSINASSQSPSISASEDGRILTWLGAQLDLDPGVPPQDSQIYIKNTETGVIRQVRADNGDDLGLADFPHVSEDGSFVVFRVGTYFTPICGRFSIVGIDTRTWQRECISQNDAGVSSDGSSHYIGVSSDGNRVVFDGLSTTLGPYPLNMVRIQSGVYVRDRRLRRTVRVDVNAAGVPSNGNGNGGAFDTQGHKSLRYPSISKNGRWVVFASNGSNLVPNDSNGHGNDVFRVDLNQFFSGPIAPLVPVPALSLWAGLLLILTVMGSSVWLKRGPAL